MRKVVLTIVLLCALVIGGAVVALLTIDVNQFRPLLVTQLQAATGRRVELASIHRSWKQGLGLGLRGLVIHEDPAFGAEPMLAVEQASARLRLAPLLKRRLELATVTLDHPTIRVIKNAAGQLSVSTMAKGAPAAPSSKASVLPFLVSSLTIRSATVSYRDASAVPPLTVEVRDVDMAASNITLVNGVPQATLAVRNGTVALSRLQRPIDSVAMDVRVTPALLDVTQLTALIGNGVIAGAAAIHNYRTQPTIDAQLTLRKIVIQDVLPPPASARAAQRLEGVLSGDIAVQGSGAAWQELSRTLSGRVNASVTDARVTNLNLLREAFNKLSMLPGVVERLEAKLPERHKQLLQQRDTAIRELHVTGRIEHGALIIDPLRVATDVGALNGQGRISVDGRVDISALLVIPTDLSASIAQSVKELSALEDESGAMTFPLAISGRPPQIAVQPDISYIAQRVIVTKGAELIERLLSKGEAPQGTPSAQPPSDSNTSNNTPEQLLRDLLRGKR